jgi:hypothetical protein
MGFAPGSARGSENPDAIVLSIVISEVRATIGEVSETAVEDARSLPVDETDGAHRQRWRTGHEYGRRAAVGRQAFVEVVIAELGVSGRYRGTQNENGAQTLRETAPGYRIDF